MANSTHPQEEAQKHFEKAETLMDQGKYAAAIDLFRQALANDPTLLSAHRRLAEALKRLGKPEEAISELENTLAQFPESKDLWNDWGNILFDKGDFNGAIHKYQKSLEIDPLYKWAYFNWGLALQNQGDHDKAILQFQKALEIDPNYVIAHANMGASLRKTGEYAQSQEAFEKAISLDPKNPNHFNDLGNLLYEQQDYERAIEQYRQCIHIDPSHKWAHYNWGLALENLGFVNEAIDKYNQTLKIDPNYTEALQSLAIALNKMGKKKEALGTFRKVEQLAPAKAETYYSLGNLYADSGDDKEAIFNYRKAIGLRSHYPDAFNALGNVLYNQGQFGEALANYQQAAKLDRRHKWALLNSGLAYNNLEQYEEAIKQYDKALKLDKKYTEAYINKGYALGKLGRNEEAVKEYKQAIALSPSFQLAFTNWRYLLPLLPSKELATREFEEAAVQAGTAGAYQELGHLYLYDLKKSDLALKNYQKALEINSSNADIYLDIGNAHAEILDYETALGFYKTALEKDKTYAYAAHNIAFYLGKMGRYEEAYANWEEAVDLYRQEIDHPKLRWNVWNYFYLGSILRDTFKDYEGSERVLQEGLKKDPQNLHICAAITSLYHEMLDSQVTVDPSLIWKAGKVLKKGEEIYQKLENKTGQNKLLLAEIYFLSGQYDKAEALIDEAIKENNSNTDAFNWKGIIKLKSKEPKEAIKYFRKALNFNRTNFPVRANLAKAFLENKELDLAEREYREVLKKNPKYVDAQIGMGEVYLAVADQRNGDAELYDMAEDYYKKAITLGNSRDASKQLTHHRAVNKTESRVYKDVELAEIYYSRGYLRVKKFETNPVLSGIRTLYDALEDFKTAKELNPDHHQADRARLRLGTKLRSSRSERFFERFGPWFIAIFSMIILVLSQIFFYFPPKPAQKQLYKIGDENSAFFSVIGLSDEQLGKLDTIKNVVFDNKQAMLDAVENIVGLQTFHSNQLFLESLQFETLRPEVPGSRLAPGFYALITFASLLFIIAGFYLPQMLKLKVGAIEIEKNTVSSASIGASIGIEKSSMGSLSTSSTLGISK